MANIEREDLSLLAEPARVWATAAATGIGRISLIVLLGATATPVAADSVGGPIGPAVHAVHTDDEATLIAALADLREQRLDVAIERLERLLARNPTFRLAHMVYGDMLLAKAGRFSAPGPIAVEDLLLEARQRYDHHHNPVPPDLLPANLLQLSENQRHAVVVEVDRSRLYLFERKGERMRLIADYYAGAGKNGAEKRREGDKKTPIGVYEVSGHIDGSELPELYGAGALPIDYPNAWDRLQGYTGSGIWLHGVPRDTYSRSPLSSDGCVTLANADFDSLRLRVASGDVPVIIVREVNWQPRADIRARRETIAATLETWRQDWESMDYSRYAAHFSKSFRSPGRDQEPGIALQQRVNGQSFVQVGISNLSMFAYPGLPGTVVVSFDQDYRSDNYNGKIRKQQYWSLEDDEVWRIIYEGDS